MKATVGSADSGMLMNGFGVVELSGAECAQIPDLVGQKFDDVLAVESVGTEDYDALVSDQELSDTVAEGKVIRQSPVADELAQRDVKIVVVVSQGARMRLLPEI